MVHLFGHPVDMDPILALAKKHNLFVIEDAAQAHGSRYKGKIVGALGDSGTFSFFGNKILTTGEGGMVVTNQTASNHKMRLLRGQGMSPQRRYWFEVVGYNYRMTNLQAAIGYAQLEMVDWHLNRHREVAQAYREQLGQLSTEGIVQLPTEKSYAKPCYWMFTILINEGSKIERDELIRRLMPTESRRAPSSIPMFLMPPYLEAADRYPVAAAVAFGASAFLPTVLSLRMRFLTCARDFAFTVRGNDRGFTKCLLAHDIVPNDG